jgi:hypothetical protein
MVTASDRIAAVRPADTPSRRRGIAAAHSRRTIDVDINGIPFAVASRWVRELTLKMRTLSGNEWRSNE